MGNSNVTNIGSLRTFLDYFEKLVYDPECLYFFRGHPDYEYKLEPSIYRLSGWITNEDKMIREIILRCPDDFKYCKTTFEYLVKMQHYSMPTRLLDITGNPLIALYFACIGDKENKKLGEVVILRIPKNEVKYFDSDTVSVISNISKRPINFSIEHIYHLSKHKFNKREEIQYLLHEVKQEKPYFKDKIEKGHLNSVICVKSKLDNPRIIRQDGAFLLFGMNMEKNNHAIIPQNYTDIGKTRLIINDKVKILNQLEKLGIMQGKLFPEIESVSNYVKSIY